jgi:FlaA1/EpsC-like NDP-sugar epimerase
MIENLENFLFGNKIRYSLNIKEAQEIKRDLKNSNILITGAAGSIGSIFTKSLKNYDFKKLYLIDKDENLLTDLARLVNLEFKYKIKKIIFICSDINTLNLNKFLKINSITHYLNFAALKHVRSEENFNSCMYMYNTNCIYPFKIGNLSKLKKLKKIFFISTDKAVYPLSVMGLTKKIMEHKLFNLKKKYPKKFISSVRFANVSFSNGSLLKSVYEKTINKSTFGVPTKIKRYFIKQKEAANLCFKSLLKISDGQIVLPSYESIGKPYDLVDLTKKIVKFLGKKPVFLTKLNNKKINGQKIILQKTNIMGQKNIEKLYEGDETIKNLNNNNLILKTSFRNLKKLNRNEIQILKSKNIKQFRVSLKNFSNNKKFKILSMGIELNKII